MEALQVDQTTLGTMEKHFGEEEDEDIILPIWDKHYERSVFLAKQ